MISTLEVRGETRRERRSAAMRCFFSRLRCERREAGFTLIEMLVAVAILAVLVGLVPRSFVFARSIIDHSRDWTNARLVAESVLNDALTAPLQPGTRSGTLDNRRWRATLRPRGVLGASTLGNGEMLLEVRVEVDVSAGRTLEVETMRIGGRPQ
jgi:prepilin-type N-terminal cleavage/methylation domain-containing protein